MLLNINNNELFCFLIYTFIQLKYMKKYKILIILHILQICFLMVSFKLICGFNKNNQYYILKWHA